MGYPIESFYGSLLLDGKYLGKFIVAKSLTHLRHSEQSCSLLNMSSP